MKHWALTLPQTGLVDSALFANARLVRTDGSHCALQVSVDAKSVRFDQPQNDDGTLMLPMHVPGYGTAILPLTSLMSRAEPYRLLPELARGQVNALRDQVAVLHQFGYQVPGSLSSRLAQVTRQLAAAVMSDDAVLADRQAMVVLSEALRFSDDVADMIAQLALALPEGLAEGSLGVGVDPRGWPMGQADAIGSRVDHVMVRPIWSQLESQQGRVDWDALDRIVDSLAERNGRIIMGPILDLHEAYLPAWLDSWIDDRQTLEILLINYMETLLDRYRDRVSDWILIHRVHSTHVFGYRSEQLLKLAEAVFAAARAYDGEGKFALGIDLPWGDDAPPGRWLRFPSIFVDTLIRSGTTLSSLYLEVMHGFPSSGSFCRPLAQLSRLIDQFHDLGTNIHVGLGYPSASESGSESPGERGYFVSREGLAEETQAQWAARAARVALAKPFVREATWVHAWDDPNERSFPYAGLFAADGRAKQALHALTHIRASVES